MNTYLKGTDVYWRVEVKTPADVLTDPVDLTLTLYIAGNPTPFATYQKADMARLSTGVYEIKVNASEARRWVGFWQSTDPTAVTRHEIYVDD